MPGGPEIFVIILVALIVLGPDQLPKAMRTFGNVMAEIRKVSNSFQSEMRSAIDAIDTSGSDAKPSTTPTAADTATTAGPAEAGDAPDSAAVGAPSPAVLDVDATPVVNEVVARNDTPAPTADGAPAADPDPSTSRPSFDPADRAAG